MAFWKKRDPGEGAWSIEEYARRFAAWVRTSHPEASVSVEEEYAGRPLLRWSRIPRIGELAQWPDSFHARYLQNPADPEATFALQYRAAQESGVPLTGEERILPVVKSREWMASALRAAREQLGSHVQADDVTLPYYQDFVGDLVVCYVIDTPANMEYISRVSMTRHGMDADTMRKRAFRDLLALYEQEAELRSDGEQCAIVTPEGDYTASMALLLSEVEKSLNWPDGAIVAIPDRSTVRMHRRTDEVAIEWLRGLAQQIHAQSAYPVSPGVYLWRNRELTAL